MSWSFHRRPKETIPAARRVTADERRLITEAIEAGRVTLCPTRTAPVIAPSLLGRAASVEMANDILRVERAG